MMAGMIAVPAVPLLPLLVGVFLFLGISEGGVDVGGNTLIVWRHGAAGRAVYERYALLFRRRLLRRPPIIIAQAMLRTGGITWAYRLLALLMLPAVIRVYRTPSPRPPAVHEQEGLRRCPGRGRFF